MSKQQKRKPIAISQNNFVQGEREFMSSLTPKTTTIDNKITKANNCQMFISLINCKIQENNATANATKITTPPM